MKKPLFIPVIKMRWGKHKGKPIRRCPQDYLKWAVEKCPQLFYEDEMQEALERISQPANWDRMSADERLTYALNYKERGEV